MLLDIVRQSLSTLWAHKLRSFLTMFGIAWGVGSLLLLVGLGEGFRSGQEKELANLGQNIMFMFPGRIPAVEGSTQSGQTYYFTYKDYLAIRDEAKYVGALSPVLNREDGQIFGVAADYNQIRNVPISPGRWFNNQDNSDRRRVAVVGWELLKNIFPGRPAVGSTILLNGMSFDVIGSRGDDFGARPVIFHRGDALERFRRIADHSAVRRDQRHAGADQPAHAVGFVVEARDGRRLGSRVMTGQQFGRQTRFGRKRLFQALVGAALHGPRKQRSRHHQRDQRGENGRKKQFRAE